MKRLIITLAIVFAFFAQGIAQAQKNIVGVSWGINFPNNGSYLTKTSLAGGKIEYRYMINKQFSAGLSFDWCTYEQYLPRQTFQKPDGNSAVTTDMVVQAYQLPMTATFHYYIPMKKDALKPYIGVGLGAQYLEQSAYYNVYVSDENNWGFVVRPELGVIGKINANIGFLVAGYYSYATNKTEVLDRNSFSNFGLNIGIVFTK